MGSLGCFAPILEKTEKRERVTSKLWGRELASWRYNGTRSLRGLGGLGELRVPGLLERSNDIPGRCNIRRRRLRV
jgi:hypothetical protein